MTEDDLRPARPTPRREEPEGRAPEGTQGPPPESGPTLVAPGGVPVADDEAVALERGRTAAMVAALGRVQMSLDILTRKVAALEAAVRDLQR
jgi:hypothetical protein